MQKIRIVEPGWEGFSGLLGMVEFKDGVSEQPVPEIMADRITSTIRCESVPEDGEEAQQVGVSSRMVVRDIIAGVAEPLQQQSEREKEIEDHLVKLRNSKEAELEIYSQAELEEIVAKDGLTGLRKIADLWKVRDRAIPKLIEKILVAQSEFMAARKAAEEDAAAAFGADRIVAEVIAEAGESQAEEGRTIEPKEGEQTAPVKDPNVKETTTDGEDEPEADGEGDDENGKDA